MTVTTAPVGGPIFIGAFITGSGIPAGYYITSFGTGVGGTGTYGICNNCNVGVIAVVATGGVPHNAVLPAYWGVPQEGDGAATALSTASAVVSIDLTGATAAAGTTVSVAGALLTCVASAAVANQFNAGTDAALAASIASAINAATNTVNAAAAGWFAHQLRNTVYARSVGASLQIMTRAGSTTYNANALFQVAQSGLTGIVSAGPFLFSGGVSGAWGWLWSIWDCAFLPSGFTAAGYGLWGMTQALAGNYVGGDIVNIRAAKIVTTCNASQYHPQLYLRPMGALGNPCVFRIDDGTAWPADGTTPVLNINTFGGNGHNCSFFVRNYAQPESFFRLIGKRYAAGNANIRLYPIGTHQLNLAYSSGTIIENIDVEQTFAGNPAKIQNSDYGSMRDPFDARITGLKLTTANDSPVINVSGGNGNYCRLQLKDSDFINTSATANSGVFSSSVSDGADIRLDNVRFSGFVANSKLQTPDTNTNNTGVSNRLVMTNCTMGNVVAKQTYSTTAVAGSLRYATGYSQYGTRDFFYDVMAGFVEWNGTRSFPTLNAKLLDGVTPWSIHAVPATIAANISALSPLELPRVSKLNSLADGARTVTLEYAVEQSLTLDTSKIAVLFQYQAVGGAIVTVDTFTFVSGTPLTVSTTTWSNEVAGKVYYPLDSTSHNKYKMVVSTVAGKPMATNTEFNMIFRIYASVINTTKGIFIDPELQVV